MWQDASWSCSRSVRVAGFGLVVLLAVLVSPESRPAAPSPKVLLADDFSDYDPVGSGRYVELDEGFRQAGGVLRIEAGAGQRPLLGILPAAGANARLAFDARWVAGDGYTALLILADWRYRYSKHIGVYLLFDRNYVMFHGNPGAHSGRAFAFRRGATHRVELLRTPAALLLSIDGQKLIETRLWPKTGDVNASPEEAAYGGFALGIEKDPLPRTIEIDRLELTGDPSPVTFESYVRPFRLRGQEHLYAVIHERGHGRVAREEAAQAVEFIQYLTSVFGVLPMKRRLGRVQARGQYFEKGYGYNSEGFVLMTLPPDGQAGRGLEFYNCHEAGHNWQHLFGKRWNVEASADAACYLDSQVRRGRRPWFVNVIHSAPGVRERAAVGKSEGIHLDDDRSLTFSGLPTGSFWDAAFKTTVFGYLLYRVLGTDGYREFHREAQRRGGSLDSAGTQAAAERVTGLDLSTLFRGWVFPGDGKFRLIDSVRDTDGDGLMDLDETLVGTSASKRDSDGDGFSDLGELLFGSDPTSAREPAAQLASSGRRALVLADGLSGDWERARRLGAVRSVVDADEGKGDADVRLVEHLGDRTNRMYYFRVALGRAFARETAARDRTFVTVDIAVGQPGQIDFRFNFFPLTGVIGAFRTSGHFQHGGVWAPDRWTGLSTGGVAMAHGEDGGAAFVELGIPADTLGRDRVLAYVSTGSPSGSDWLDKAPLELSLDRESIPATARPLPAFRAFPRSGSRP